MTNQQAINILNGLEQCLDDYCELNDEGKAAFCMAVTALELFGNSEQLPSAHPEREKGKWIEITPEEGHDIYTVKCDQCGRYEFFETNYCSNCGADMKGEANV